MHCMHVWNTGKGSQEDKYDRNNIAEVFFT